MHAISYINIYFSVCLVSWQLTKLFSLMSIIKVLILNQTITSTELLLAPGVIDGTGSKLGEVCFADLSAHVLVRIEKSVVLF